jgi:hypothetical protein
MTVLLNNKKRTFPSSLSEFTLGQRISFDNQYGYELEKMRVSIAEMEEGPLREIEAGHFYFEKMFRTVAFFLNCTVESLKESSFINEIGGIYNSCLAVLFEEQDTMEPVYSFQWNGEEWNIAAPELKNGDDMSFGEFVDSKQIVKDMVELGKGKWEYMLPLCAVYLRKKGEPYQEEFLFEDSERLKQMEKLPMDIAMQVGFFLISTQNIYLSTSKSFGSPEQREQEDIPKVISIGTVG